MVQKSPINITTPLKPNSTKFLLLGSGELGKEVALELMRLGVEVIACDSYENAPAMQVAHKSHVFSMLDAQKLREIVLLEKPNIIVPEVEAIATEELMRIEAEFPHIQVVPTAKATFLTMNREGIRRLAAEELKLPTAKYEFAQTFAEFKNAAEKLGFPCVVKPIMSSSGKGQSVVKTLQDLEKCWENAQAGGRAGAGKVIVEEFISFDSEITLLTVRTINGTSFCEPIGHIQQDGDYIESWQPHFMSREQLIKSHEIAEKITSALGGYGLFGVELFLLKNGQVIFSEVSPRPHDTGMVTMATQYLSEFALHARAILGFPIPEIKFISPGASVALRATENSDAPAILNVEKIFEEAGVDFRFFGKPKSHAKRRMGVILAQGESTQSALEKARRAAAKVVLK